MVHGTLFPIPLFAISNNLIIRSDQDLENIYWTKVYAVIPSTQN
jgi:hypothetical protein